MKCPYQEIYQDIGCWYIDDVSYDCEAETMSQCRHASHEPEQNRKNERNEEDDE